MKRKYVKWLYCSFGASALSFISLVVLILTNLEQQSMGGIRYYQVNLPFDLLAVPLVLMVSGMFFGLALPIMILATSEH
jgi:hypothetical protein